MLAGVSYWHVLGGEGLEAALAKWDCMLAVVVLFGGGAISLDRLSGRGTHS